MKTFLGKSPDELLAETYDNIRYLELCGYTVITQWECLFEKPKKVTSCLGARATLPEILQKIENCEFYGYVECDVKTPEHLKEQYDEFPLIFKNAEVSIDQVGEFMKNYAEKNNLLRKPSRLLISSHHAEKILLSSDLVKYYLSMGVEINKIYTLIEFPEASAKFSECVKIAEDNRRLSDINPEFKPLAELSKLLYNSIYGKACQNNLGHTTVKYGDERTSSRLINSNKFRSCQKLGENIFEFKMAKKKIIENLPIHLAFQVYSDAKLRMLLFFYSCCKFYYQPDSYQNVFMDTDSLYIAYSHSDFEDGIKPHLRRKYFENYKKIFPRLACENHEAEFIELRTEGKKFIQKPCCLKAHLYYSREAGLFKTEFIANGEKGGCVALCSKTYHCFSEDAQKIGCKGIQKSARNKDSLTLERYLNVLDTQIKGSGVNLGFRAVKGKMMTYEQRRFGLSYLYVKRKICPDGINTKCLDV